MPKAERKVSSELEKLEYDVYLPTVKVMRQWRDRKKKLTVPLFPNYVFVNTIPSRRNTILKLPGALRFLSTSGTVDSISEREIELIRRIITHDNPQVINHRFQIGDSVKFTSGPFNGIEGTLITLNGRRKLFVHLNTLGKSIVVETNPEALSL